MPLTGRHGLAVVKAERTVEKEGDRAYNFGCGKRCPDQAFWGGRSPLPVSSDQVTGLLRDWSDGEEGALERLVPLVEAELRRLARGYMGRERRDHTLQVAALVNEAFLRLTDAPITIVQNWAGGLQR